MQLSKIAVARVERSAPPYCCAYESAIKQSVARRNPSYTKIAAPPLEAYIWRIVVCTSSKAASAYTATPPPFPAVEAFITDWFTIA
eukprot:7379497-Prymnesium_polylepis.2